MKFIGQYIQSFIARFRSDVYLEDVSTGTIASGGNLGLDSNNKIVKAAEATGDITGVTITTDSGGGSKAEDTSGSADFSILGTSGVGVTNSGTTITATSVPGEIDHDSLLNFAANEHYTQANITTVGTIGTGVWQGTAIATAYIADDAITEDKLANTLLAEIDANTAKVTNVSTNLSQTTASDSLRINSSDGTNVIIAEASGSIAGVMTVAHHDKLDGIEASATADQSSAEILTAIEDGVDSVHYVDGSIDTVHIADDQVTFAKAVGVTPNIYGSIIKVLPSDFMANEEPGVTKTLQFVDNDASGIKPGDNGTELLAFVSIPETMKATHVDVYADDTLAFSVYELNIHESVGDISAASKGTGNCNTTLDITDVNATATNYLLIQVITVSKADRVFGAKVTIATQ